jgi:hypothetical protein
VQIWHFGQTWTKRDGGFADRAAHFTLSHVSPPPTQLLAGPGGPCASAPVLRRVFGQPRSQQTTKSDPAADEQRRVIACVELRKVAVAGACGRRAGGAFCGQRFHERRSKW